MDIVIIYTYGVRSIFKFKKIYYHKDPSTKARERMSRQFTVGFYLLLS